MILLAQITRPPSVENRQPVKMRLRSLDGRPLASCFHMLSQEQAPQGHAATSFVGHDDGRLPMRCLELNRTALLRQRARPNKNRMKVEKQTPQD